VEIYRRVSGTRGSPITATFFHLNHPLGLRAFQTTMEDAPPPTEHILRPHHLVLLSILMIAFKDLEIKKFPPEFSTHLLRTLLNEVSEVRGKEQKPY
jgi:hypothetical protein